MGAHMAAVRDLGRDPVCKSQKRRARIAVTANRRGHVQQPREGPEFARRCGPHSCLGRGPTRHVTGSP